MVVWSGVIHCALLRRSGAREDAMNDAATQERREIARD